LADLAISDERAEDARKSAEAALAQNPRDEEALGRLAAAYRLLVDPIRAGAVEARALAQNPRPVAFYSAVGERLADRRKYHSAERAFLSAIAADAEAAAPRIGLGMLYMQTGREMEANDLFESAFQADPFNIRASNMRIVLRHLAAYETIETEHYLIRTPPGRDAFVGRYMAKYLEEIHGSLRERFGFAPPGKTLIEVMQDHEKFSGRTVALPFIPTVGACTGKMIALASPRTTGKPYNWSRVLVHEMTHVWNLAQSDFNIPHWYTEALAVESERSPRPQPWNKMLQERVPARKLLNLETINLGFIRPKEADERQLAYCQAQLYAQYMTKRFGPEAQIKLLMAYREGLATPEAITRAFGVSTKDFESKYLDYLDEVVAGIRSRAEAETEDSFSDLERRLAEKPDDADLNAKLAYEHFARRDLQAARPLAEKALELNPKQALACYVKARLLESIGDQAGALALLAPAHDPKNPDGRVMDLLAELLMKADRLEEAERMYQEAHDADPQQSRWIAGLARVHLRAGSRDKLRADLALLAANDPDDLSVRRTLALEAFRATDYAESERWAMECLYIKTDDPVYHVMLGDARAAQAKHDPAAEEYRAALELTPKEPDAIRLKLAKSLIVAGKKDEARAELAEVLKADPENEEAKALHETLGPGA
jgi:tetratricopeptide (TPR) repeat protein